MLLGIFVGVLILGQVVYQIVYPGARLIPGTTVDGVDIGGMHKDEAASKLNGLYGGLKLKIFFGKNGAAFLTPAMKDVGIGVDNTARLEPMGYPFWLRLVPTSIFWAAGMQTTGDIEYTYDKNKIADYTQSKVGSDCSIPYQNASLKLIDSQLQLVPSIAGGRCDLTEFQQALAKVQPSSDADNKVTISTVETAAPITDNMARDLAAKLNGRMSAAMPIKVDNNTDNIPGRVVLSWLDFTADVPEQSLVKKANEQARLLFAVNSKRMLDYLHQGIAAKLIKTPGVSKVSTLDFNETSRVDGAPGRDLDIPKITQSVADYINGKLQQAVGATVSVPPTVKYTRSYSPTSNGFTALFTQFAQDNPEAKWGISFEEISGAEKKRKASYNTSAVMPAAGIESMYIAYVDLLELKTGFIRPVDVISGSTGETECFKMMLTQFDKGCRDGFYNFFGYARMMDRIKAAGLNSTVFGDKTTTTAGDLQTMTKGLYVGSLARAEGGTRVLETSRTSTDNDGIPKGTGLKSMQHIVGQSETVHNDTAVVYDTNYGAYILTIMSDGTTDWSKVADLANRVHTLKKIKLPVGAS